MARLAALSAPRRASQTALAGIDRRLGQAVLDDGGRDELRELAPKRISSAAIIARSSTITASCAATRASSSS